MELELIQMELYPWWVFMAKLPNLIEENVQPAGRKYPWHKFIFQWSLTTSK